MIVTMTGRGGRGERVQRSCSRSHLSMAPCLSVSPVHASAVFFNPVAKGVCAALVYIRDRMFARPFRPTFEFERTNGELIWIWSVESSSSSSLASLPLFLDRGIELRNRFHEEQKLARFGDAFEKHNSRGNSSIPRLKKYRCSGNQPRQLEQNTGCTCTIYSWTWVGLTFA